MERRNRICQVSWLCIFLLSGCYTPPTKNTPIPQVSTNQEIRPSNTSRLNPEAIMRTYYDVWNVPARASRDEARVTTRITVANDGRVLAARITKSSGNGDVDRSVQDALDHVHQITGFTVNPTNRVDQFTVVVVFNSLSKDNSLDRSPKISGGANGK
jgi:TonB family protein